MDVHVTELLSPFLRAQCECIPSLDLIFFPIQGEDGFPGFKGDMGPKGDRVSDSLSRMLLILNE